MPVTVSSRGVIEEGLTKADALEEAKRALRRMTWNEARARLDLSEAELADHQRAREIALAKGSALKMRPWDHPFYWASFVLIGASD